MTGRTSVAKASCNKDSAPTKSHFPRASVQQVFSTYQVTFSLRVAKLTVVDQSGLGKKPLGHGHSLDHGFNLPFEVVALIDHVSDVRLLAALRFEEENLVENAEDLIGVNRSERQIIIRIAPIVEVKTAKHILR